jgi:hypothetical protein
MLWILVRRLFVGNTSSEAVLDSGGMKISNIHRKTSLHFKKHHAQEVIRAQINMRDTKKYKKNTDNLQNWSWNDFSC